MILLAYSPAQTDLKPGKHNALKKWFSMQRNLNILSKVFAQTCFKGLWSDTEGKQFLKPILQETSCLKSHVVIASQDQNQNKMQNNDDNKNSALNVRC